MDDPHGDRISIQEVHLILVEHNAWTSIIVICKQYYYAKGKKQSALYRLDDQVGPFCRHVKLFTQFSALWLFHLLGVK